MARSPSLKPGDRRVAPEPKPLEPKWGGRRPAPPSEPPSENQGLASERLRARMVERLRQTGIADEGVLRAMGQLPRHRFVDPALASRVYEDTALPIGYQQTLSQPFVVARSLSLARAYCRASGGVQRALEVGTGCGYQAAVMASLFPTVASIERIEGLHQDARRNLAPLALSNLHLLLGDGLQGCEAMAPFEVMVLAAGLPDMPRELLRQLGVGGVMVVPLGWPDQRLVVVRRGLDDQTGAPVFERFEFDAVQFVPILKGVQR